MAYDSHEFEAYICTFNNNRGQLSLGVNRYHKEYTNIVLIPSKYHGICYEMNISNKVLAKHIQKLFDNN